MASMTETLARRAVDRRTAERQSEYAREMGRIVEATYDHIEESGSLEPSLRDILRSAGISTQGFYRYFRSKDELMLVLLDDGRRRLGDYLAERMTTATSPSGQVRAWVEGVLVQASHARSAARTRPFAANEDRLTELFPDEQRASVDLLVGLLIEPIRAATDRPQSAGDDAEAVYRLAFGVLRSHLLRRTRPTAAEVEHVVGFCLRGIGIDEEGDA